MKDRESCVVLKKVAIATVLPKYLWYNALVMQMQIPYGLTEPLPICPVYTERTPYPAPLPNVCIAK